MDSAHRGVRATTPPRVPPDMDTAEVGPGWHWYLDRLVASLANSPMLDWELYYPALAAAYG